MRSERPHCLFLTHPKNGSVSRFTLILEAITLRPGYFCMVQTNTATLKVAVIFAKAMSIIKNKALQENLWVDLIFIRKTLCFINNLQFFMWIIFWYPVCNLWFWSYPQGPRALFAWITEQAAVDLWITPLRATKSTHKFSWRGLFIK